MTELLIAIPISALSLSVVAALVLLVADVALIEGLSILRGAGREAVLAPRVRTQVHAAVEALILSAGKPVP